MAIEQDLGDYKILKRVFVSLLHIGKFLGQEYGTVFCPFHSDTIHKSAKIFNDEDGSQRLYCWAENRQYDSYDYVRYVLHQEPIVFLRTYFTREVLQEVVEQVKSAKKVEGSVVHHKEMLEQLGKIYIQRDNLDGFLESYYSLFGDTYADDNKR